MALSGPQGPYDPNQSYSMSPPPPPSPYGHPGQHSGMHAPPPKTSGFAIASLVLGIVGVCLSWIPYVGIPSAIVGVILGAIAIKQINERPTQLTGKGMAIAGLVLGIVAIGLVIVFFAWLLAVLGELGASGGEF